MSHDERVHLVLARERFEQFEKERYYFEAAARMQSATGDKGNFHLAGLAPSTAYSSPGVRASMSARSLGRPAARLLRRNDSRPRKRTLWLPSGPSTQSDAAS